MSGKFDFYLSIAHDKGLCALVKRCNGKQKEYEERTKAKKKAEIEARKQAIRTEDIARGVFIPVSSLPQLGPRKGA